MTGLYMISLKTIVPRGSGSAFVNTTVRVKLLTTAPARLRPSTTISFVGELTGKVIVQAEIEVHLIGYSTPLTVMVCIVTGAVPLSVTRLLPVTMKLVLLMAKAALPP